MAFMKDVVCWVYTLSIAIDQKEHSKLIYKFV